MNATVLKDYAITHGGIRRVKHPQLGIEINGQTATRYLRFLGTARLTRLELPRAVYGRWVPAVPTHPAHLIISTLNRSTNRWETIKEVQLPRDPRTAGDGLSQNRPIADMDAHFAQILKEGPYVIDLDGLETDHLRVVCDAEHETWSNHGEVNGGPFHVPFGILNPLRAYGELLQPGFLDPAYRPTLKLGKIQPDKQARVLPHQVLFASKKLSVGFSLRRPLVTHLGWDALGEQAEHNRMLFTKRRDPGGLSGPVLRTLAFDAPPHLWTGEVSVVGNQVIYQNLTYAAGLTVDATFTVEPDRLLVQLTQHCTAALPVIEAETWRFAWDLTAGITGAAALPTLAPGRNGEVRLPALWATDGVGCLSCRVLEGDARLQVESYRDQNAVSGGICLGDRPDAEASGTLPLGTRRATLELAVTNLEPAGPAPSSDGVRRHWATTFACFRPELGGFSNNSASTNCHQSQGAPLEIVAHTRPPEHGPSPVELGRFCVGRALLGGGGYGFWRNLYLDSDPVLVSAAGRLHQAQPDAEWLRGIEPGLVTAAERMLGNMGADGLIVCRDLTGNYGSFRWSSNAMDVVGFGHIDGYANAWTYRALRNATALLGELKQEPLAARCRAAADSIRGHYSAQLLNPETGWVAGWRSRDGVLHDYAFTWVNGVAIAFGLLEDEAARRALQGLEQLRQQLGIGSAQLGLPCNLLPIRVDDHMLPHGYYLPLAQGHIEPTFENYTDGSLSGWSVTYYLRALSIYGLKDHAHRLSTELAAGYAAGIHNGGIGTGHEFRSWEGCPNGYEGTLIGCFSPMYSIAIEQGSLQPSAPEWWPAGG